MSGNKVFVGGGAFAQANIAVPESESLMAPGLRQGWGDKMNQIFSIKHLLSKKI